MPMRLTAPPSFPTSLKSYLTQIMETHPNSMIRNDHLKIIALARISSMCDLSHLFPFLANPAKAPA